MSIEQNSNSTFLKRTNHDLVGYIPGMQGWLKDEKKRNKYLTQKSRKRTTKYTKRK